MSSTSSPRLTNKQQYWLEHIRRAKSGQQALTDYAKEHELSLKALYNYHWLLRKKGLLAETASTTGFVQVARQNNDASDLAITLDFPNGMRVCVQSDAHDLPGMLKLVSGL